MKFHYVSNLFQTVKANTWDRIWDRVMDVKIAVKKSKLKREFQKSLKREDEDIQVMGFHPNRKRKPSDLKVPVNKKKGKKK